MINNRSLLAFKHILVWMIDYTTKLKDNCKVKGDFMIQVCSDVKIINCKLD